MFRLHTYIAKYTQNGMSKLKEICLSGGISNYARLETHIFSLPLSPILH